VQGDAYHVFPQLGDRDRAAVRSHSTSCIKTFDQARARHLLALTAIRLLRQLARVNQPALQPSSQPMQELVDLPARPCRLRRGTREPPLIGAVHPIYVSLSGNLPK